MSEEAVEKFDAVIIHSCRLNDPIYQDGNAIRQWMLQYGFPADVVKMLHFWTSAGKPHGSVYLDDKGYTFEGKFPSVDELLAFERWDKKLKGE